MTATVTTLVPRQGCPVWCRSPHEDDGDPLLRELGRQHSAEVAELECGIAVDVVQFDDAERGPGEVRLAVHLPDDIEVDEALAEQLAHVLTRGVQRLQLARKGLATMTWLEAFALFEDELRTRGQSEDSIYQKRLALKRLRDFLDADLLTAQEADLRRWQTRLVDDGKAIAYRACQLAHARSFYAWCLDAEIINRDPVRRLPRPKVRRRLPRPMPEESLQQALLSAPERIRPMFVLAGWAGLRAMEIANLRREDILERGQRPVLVVRNGKGDKDRVVPMADEVWATLHAFGLPMRGFVFARRDGKPGPNKPYMVSHLCNNHLHSLGIPESLHSLRHRFGTVTYEECQDLRVVQELLGHASPATTAGYAAFSPARAAEVVSRVGRTLG